MSKDIQQTHQTYEMIAADYAARWYGQRMEQAARRFRHHLDADALVLDVGCGPGRDTQHLRELGLRAIGLDRSPNMLHEAQLRGDAPWCAGDMLCLPFAPHVFAGAWACASLLHLPKIQLPQALDELHRVLQIGGTLWLSMKQGDGEVIEMDQVGQSRFFAYYAASELETLVKQAAFDVLELEVEVDQAKRPTPWIQLTARAR